MATSTLTFRGRLPGVDCDPALPAVEGPIRLDVAAFVGFAERGPLNLPIAVEDINQYRAVFGGDVVLATDAGTPVYANLPGAVQAFFDNGGRRCHVVRVAGVGVIAARWPVPGMKLRRTSGVVEDVFVEAAWPGSWSAHHVVTTQLLSQPLGVTNPYQRAHGDNRPGVLTLSPGSLLQVQPGDLVRLDLGPSMPGLYLVVDTIDRANSTAQVRTEIPVGHNPGSPPDPDAQVLLGPDDLRALPSTLQVRGAWRLQMDLIAGEIVAGVDQLLERWSSVGFNPGAGSYWLDVVQPVDVGAPDQTRSMLLRADAETVAAASAGSVFLPIGMSQLEVTVTPADDAADPSGERLSRAGQDGLAAFDAPGMFLDPDLGDTTVASLLGFADQLSTLSPHPRALTGFHALIGIDEVALLSAPDVVHIGWSPPEPTARRPVEPPVEPPLPDWSDFRDCAVPPAKPVVVEPAQPSEEARYPVLDPTSAHDLRAMLHVQAAMIQLCAARGDMMVVLGVPRHFDTAATLGWLQLLEDRLRDDQAGRIVYSPLSYAGFWHPWVRVLERSTPSLAPLRDQPADGAVCGMIAARELARGVWVAPANVPLRGPVALAAVSATDTVRLFDAHANLLVSGPGTISSLSAHTLSNDPTLLQVSVRRLIILLRRIALLEGSRYVFDANTDRFRQLVRLRFERLLEELTRRGALVAYRVVTDGGINTEDDIDNGRLIVILQIAPTSPIEFITVTLVRSGEGLLDVVVG